MSTAWNRGGSCSVARGADSKPWHTCKTVILQTCPVPRIFGTYSTPFSTSLVLLTRNHDDFENLHNLNHFTGGQHPGGLVIRLDNDPTRDLKESRCGAGDHEPRTCRRSRRQRPSHPQSLAVAQRSVCWWACSQDVGSNWTPIRAEPSGIRGTSAKVVTASGGGRPMGAANVWGER